MVVYVEFDPALQVYVAVCDDDRVIPLVARSLAEADVEADSLDEGTIWDEM
jgi:hypothetical protein